MIHISYWCGRYYKWGDYSYGKDKIRGCSKRIGGYCRDSREGDLSLDETLLKYEQGIKLYKQCITLLEDAEKNSNSRKE